MTPDEMIAIIQAHKEGKPIQSANTRCRGSQWEDCPNPHWDFFSFEYRIKPEPKPEPHYRPFKNAGEVMEAIKEHGGYVKCKGSIYLAITEIFESPDEEGFPRIKCDGLLLDAADIADWTFADGTPFGVKED